MIFSKKQIIILAGGGFLAVVIVVLILMNIRGRGEGEQRVKLTVWGFDNATVFKKLGYSYTKLKPNVELDYKQINESGYDDQLLEALALGQGPDIFVIRSGSLLKNKAKLAPVLGERFGLLNLRELFPQVVEQDFVSGGRIYALPLYLDTLTLYYNKDIFDQAGLVYPPATWETFQNHIPILRRLGEDGNISRAGAAIGGSSKTVRPAGDLIQLLMLQNGALMVSADFSRATFTEGGLRGPGTQAFNFYLQFANPASKFYTWNEGMGEDLDAFASGKAAMVFGYGRDLALIKKKNPFLNFGVAPMPQVDADKAITFADYVGFGVSKRISAVKQRPAWDFVIYATANSDSQKAYLAEVKRPPALKKLIAEMVNDPEMEVWARQALTARSWTRVDAERARQIFSEAAASALSGQSDYKKALAQAEEKATQLLKSKIERK